MATHKQALLRAVLVGVDFGKGDFLAGIEELALLVRSAGAEPVTTVTCKRGAPDAAYFRRQRQGR